MLISHRRGFLFVHIAKTGGTSIRAALSVGRWREPAYWASWVSHRASHLSGHCWGTKIPRHAPVIVAREVLPPPTFAQFFKFAFVRNPWDRLLSAYGHFQRERQDVLQQQRVSSFESFVNFMLQTPSDMMPRAALLRAIQRPQLESVIGLQGELLVDFVGRYESLASDFQQVVERLSLPSVRLPHKRRGGPRGDYRQAYSDELAARVGQHYADDLAAFQYRFDAPGAMSGTDNRDAAQAAAIAGRIPLHRHRPPTRGALGC